MKLRRTLLALALPVLMSAPALADAYTVTVFQCVNKNNKQVRVTYVDGQYRYTFGKIDDIPDIEIVRSPQQLTQNLLKTQAADTDTGHAQIMELDFKNGTYVYTVHSDYLGTKRAGGVDVYNKGKSIASIDCLPNTIVDNLSEHIYDLPERPY